MIEEIQNNLIAKISQTRKISPQAAADAYAKMIEETKFTIRLFDQNASEEEIDERALETVKNQVAPPIDSGGGDGKRHHVKMLCLAFMLQERAQGRNTIHPKNAARFIFDAGLRRTKSQKPDAKSVGDALGKEGLRLVKQPDGTYPIPSRQQHFITDKPHNIYPPDEKDCSLDALCIAYGVKSPLVKDEVINATN